MLINITLDGSYVQLGFLGKPFALQGECCFYPFHFQQTQIKTGLELYLSLPSQKILKLKVTKLWWHKDVAIVSFENIKTIEDAQTLTNSKVYIQRNDLAPLSEGEFYLHDILGFAVFDFETELEIGKVQSFSFNQGNQSIMNISLNTNEMMEILVHPFVKSVDLKLRRCYIMQPEYE